MSEPTPVSRRLAAILAADVVGYSSLIENDEATTLNRLRSRRQDVLIPLLRRYSGRIVKLMGDGVLVEFGSAVNAVRCGLDLQEEMAITNAAEPTLSPIVLRIGINVGDVVVEGQDLYGDGVIVAARLEAIAESGTIYVSSKVQEELRGKITVDFDDLGDVVLKNIERPVRVYRLGKAARAHHRDAGISIKSVNSPSLAILPLKNLGADIAGQQIADGVTEDILTELSRFRHLRVVARNTSLDSLRTRSGPQQLASEIGADYYTEGSIRAAPERLRITVQLIQAASGSRIWSEKYDVVPMDLDSVVGAIVASLEGRMVSVAAASARTKPTSDWTAFDYLLQGRELCNAYREPEAIPLFQKAVDVDPKFASAHAWLALALTVTFASNADPGMLVSAAGHARTALSLDSNDATIHHANGMVHTWLRDFERAGTHFDRAMALNPADIQIRADRCNWLRYNDRLQEALADIDGILNRNVASPPWFWAVRGEILFDMKRYADALASFGNVPGKTHREMYIAVSHAYLGDRQRASAVRDSILASGRLFSEEELRRVKPYAAEQSLNHLVDGLKLVGLLG